MTLLSSILRPPRRPPAQPPAPALTLVGDGLRVLRSDVVRVYRDDNTTPSVYIVVREQQGSHGPIDKHLRSNWSFDIVSHALGFNDHA